MAQEITDTPEGCKGPTGCICGVKDLTESGHEFGCPMYILYKQQDNRFYREPRATHMPSGVPIQTLSSYRDEFNTTADAENAHRAAIRLAIALMNKHYPEAGKWQPAPDLLGVILQIDNMTAGLIRP